MARGQTRAADQQLRLTNQFAGEAANQGRGLYGTLLPEFQRDLASGYSPEEKAAITNATIGGLGAQFDALRQRGENRVARTRNPAGFLELEDELARSQGREGATLAGGLQERFADEQQRRREGALRGLSGLYGINEEELARLLGIAPGLLQARAAGGPGFLGSLGRALGSGLGRTLASSLPI